MQISSAGDDVCHWQLTTSASTGHAGHWRRLPGQARTRSDPRSRPCQQTTATGAPGELFPSDASGVAEATRPALAANELVPGLTVELR